MLRKKLAVLFAAAMVAATVAGCGGGDTPAAAPAETAPAADTEAPAEPAPKEEAAAPAETAPAEDTAADTAAAGGTISVGYAQVGHESDWRTANTQNYQNTFTAENYSWWTVTMTMRHSWKQYVTSSVRNWIIS